MLIHINSYPGVGKLTIGRLLAARLGAKLLDNHSIYNVAFALTEFKTAEFYDTVRAVRTIAYDRAKTLPETTPLILTNAHAGDSGWGNESWDAAIALAKACGRPYRVVVLECSREENARRIQGADRAALRKPQDPSLFRQQAIDRPLLDREADDLLHLDVTRLSADAAAEAIYGWLNTLE